MPETNLHDQEETKDDFTPSAFDIEDSQTQQLQLVLDDVSFALQISDTGKAESILKQGLKDFPDNPKLLSYLSICFASAGRELEETEDLARKIIKESPREAAGPFALGKMKLMNERRHFAFTYFKRARELAGKDQFMIQQLNKQDPRQDPVFVQYHRNHLVNIVSGKIRSWYRRNFSGK